MSSPQKQPRSISSDRIVRPRTPTRPGRFPGSLLFVCSLSVLSLSATPQRCLPLDSTGPQPQSRFGYSSAQRHLGFLCDRIPFAGSSRYEQHQHHHHSSPPATATTAATKPKQQAKSRNSDSNSSSTVFAIFGVGDLDYDYRPQLISIAHHGLRASHPPPLHDILRFHLAALSTITSVFGT